MTDHHVHQLHEGDVSGPTGPAVIQALPDLNHRYGEALRRHAMGERLRYECYFFPLPTQERDESGGHQVVTMFGLYVEASGAVIGTQISGTRVMQPNGHTDEVIDGHAREMISSLLEARSHQLAQQEADARAAASRQEDPPTSGLITPNGRPITPNRTFDDMERAMNGFARGE